MKWQKKQILLIMFQLENLFGCDKGNRFIPWDGDVNVIMPLPMYEKCEKYMLNQYKGKLRWISYYDKINQP